MVKTTNGQGRAGARRRARQAARYYRERVSRRWRVLTAGQRMLPQFIIAGAPKCGTTALYWYLLSHPQVLAPYPPGYELGYFSEHYKHDVDWYRSWFPFNMTARLRSKRSGYKTIITGEHTPFYVMHPLSAARIAATLPSVRIIILLRNPVDRAYSHYQHEFRSGQEPLAFREAIAMESQRIVHEIERMQSEPDYRSVEYVRHAYLDQGEYLTKLERFFNQLQSRNIMVVNSERLFSGTQGVFDEVCNFLCLDAFKLRKTRPINAGAYAPLDTVDPDLASELRQHFQPYNESLYSYLGTDFGW